MNQKLHNNAALGSPPPVPGNVVRARGLVRPGLVELIGRLEPTLALACRYYLGWCESDGTPTQRRGSRSLQASMALLSAEAVGADPNDAVPAAIAMELLHNSTLLHDDIMDGDELRRDRPTVWSLFGTGISLLAGNVLWTSANEALLEVPGPAARIAIQVLNQAIAEVMTAQAAELSFVQREAASITMDEYLRVCVGKGGALLGCAAVLGVVMGGGTESEAEPLKMAGRYTGLAWQAANDVENIWGDPLLVGKPGYNDLRQQRKTLPVLAALQSDSATGRELAGFLHRGPIEETELDHVAALIEDAGGRTYAENVARVHLDRALEFVERAPMPSHTRTELSTLLDFVVTRRPRDARSAAQ